ncbi:MAG TPA: adenylate/guanylate cyclase domain-containing protein [Acidimicrobiia bacterium]|nr:adenylate/guanylate cyclase domain-containing protein [Acidimicrobiia bacterium]
MTAAATPRDTLRRPTVLVCDLVASTAIAEQIGEEPLWELLLEYQDACSEVIHRFDGTVYKRLGDGLLALFGIPRAHENDARRAVHAALALVAAVGQLADDVKQRFGIDLALRVGVHTGDVVVGEMGGSLEVAGKAVHQADRLQSLAEPNGVIISSETADLIGEEFELRPRGEVDLRGLSASTTTFDVLRARIDSPSIPVEPLAMVGRAEERAAVGSAWRTVLSGGSRVLLITGDAGIGKSRLARFARDHAAREGGVPLEAECSPYYTDVPFHVIGRMLFHHLSLDPEAGDDDVVGAMEASVVSAGLDPSRALPLLAPLMAVDLGDRFEKAELSPAQVAEATSDVILEWWRGLAANEARAIVIEDIDLADPSTMALIERAISERLAPGMLLVLTARPGGVLPEVGAGDLIELAPLPDEDARELVDALTPSIEGAAEEDLIELSGGNPLFLRELALAHDKSGRVVPGGLRDLLMARLDEAGDLELAQIASVVGRTIDPALLRAAAGDGDLSARIEGLIERGILSYHHDHKGERLRFVPQLLGETAYASLPTRHRQQIHSKLAEIFLAGEGDVGSASLAALHLDRAGRYLEAAETYLTAAEAASSLGAFSEALRHLERARQLAEDELPDETGAELKRVAVLRTSFVHIAREGFGSESATAAAAQAIAMAPADSVVHSAGPRLAEFSQATILGQRTEAGSILSDLEADLAVARDSDRIQIEAEIVFARGLHDFGLGRFTSSRNSFEFALDRFHGPPRHGAPWPDYPLPTDLPATANGQLIPIYWIQGDRTLSQEAAKRARRATNNLPYPMDAFNLAYAVGYAGWANLMDDEVTPALDAFREQGGLGREHGFAMWETLAAAFEAVATARLEPSEDLAEELARLRTQAAMTAGSSFQPYLLAAEAEIRLRAGNPGHALELIEESLSLADATSEFIYLPETHRLRGAANPDSAGARDDLQRAWEIAHEQDAHIFTLRATLDLALHDDSPDDVGDRITSALAAMSEPETYKEYARAKQILTSLR